MMRTTCSAFASNALQTLQVTSRQRLQHHALLCTRRKRACNRCVSQVSVSNVEKVSVRVASGADLKGVASVMVRAFCKEDEVLHGIRRSMLGRLGMGKVVEDMYERICYWEVTDQLGKRLVRPEVGGREVREAFAKRHVVLVAVDDEDCIVGCIEMGIVDVPRLLSEGVLNEVKQWEENVERAGMEGALSRQLLKGSAGSAKEISRNEKMAVEKVANRKEMEMAAYIGNLAVSSSHRRRGVGSKLVRAAQRHAREKWNRDNVCLHVDSRNVAACLLYASLGFRCELQEPEWYKAIGRMKRLFLRGSYEGDAGEGERVKDIVKKWDEARVISRKMNFFEYLLYCWHDLGRIRRLREMDCNK